MFSKGTDPLFTELPEWVNKGESSSNHTGSSNFDLPATYIIFSYPRAFTPVCNEELKELSRLVADKRMERAKVPIIAGSSDSPEAQQEFYYSEEYFGDEWYTLPSVTIKDRYCTSRGVDLLIDEHGYTRRITIAVKDDEIVYHHREFTDEKRSMDELIRVINKIKEG